MHGICALTGRALRIRLPRPPGIVRFPPRHQAVALIAGYGLVCGRGGAQDEGGRVIVAVAGVVLGQRAAQLINWSTRMPVGGHSKRVQLSMERWAPHARGTRTCPGAAGAGGRLLSLRHPRTCRSEAMEWRSMLISGGSLRSCSSVMSSVEAAARGGAARRAHQAPASSPGAVRLAALGL